MTEVTAWTTESAVVSRDLTPAEVADLDALRFALASTVDRTEPRAIAWLWDKLIAESAGGPAPAGFVEAIATALGDLLAVHVPTVRWSVWPGPAGPTLGVASAARPTAPVVPFLDAQDHWASGARDWVVDYLARAAAHLAAATVPRPRHAPDGPAAGTPVDEAAAPIEDAPIEDAATEDAAPPDEVEAPADEAAPVDEATAVDEATRVIDETAHVIDEAPAIRDELANVEVPAAHVPDPWVPDEPLLDFALATLDHALTVLREVGAFDREAFVVLVGRAGRRTESCRGEAVEALHSARQLVVTSGVPRAAVAWVDRAPQGLPGPQQRFPAVIVDAWQAGEGVRVAHRFVDDMLGTDLLGDVLVVGPTGRLL